MIPFLHKAGIRKFLDKIPEDCDVMMDASKTQYLDTDIEEITTYVNANKDGKRDWQFIR
jgi:hypothetical protein